MNKEYSERLAAFYEEMHALGAQAKQIITEFVKSHGGRFEIETERTGEAWLNDREYATGLETEGDGCIFVLTSGEEAYNLEDLMPYEIMDLANTLNNLRN